MGHLRGLAPLYEEESFDTFTYHQNSVRKFFRMLSINFVLSSRKMVTMEI